MGSYGDHCPEGDLDHFELSTRRQLVVDLSDVKKVLSCLLLRLLAIMSTGKDLNLRTCLGLLSARVARV